MANLNLNTKRSWTSLDLFAFPLENASESITPSIDWKNYFVKTFFLIYSTIYGTDWKRIFTVRLKLFFLRYVTSCSLQFFQILKWLKIPEDSSDFDDSWTELIVMTWTLIWSLLRKFQPKFIFRIPQASRKYFPESRRPNCFSESCWPIFCL